MRSARLVLSSLLVALPACGTVSLGGDAPDGDDAGPLTADASSADTGANARDAGAGEDARADAGQDAAPTGLPDATVDAADAAPAPGADAAADAASDAGDAGDAGDGGSSPDYVLEDAGTTSTFYAVGGTGPNDVYIAGVSGIYHSTGDGRWTQEWNGPAIESIATNGPGQVFASGEFGEVLRRNGDGTWSQYTSCGKPGVVHAPPTPISGGGAVATSGNTLYYVFENDSSSWGSGVCTQLDDTADAGQSDRTWYDTRFLATVFASPSGQAYVAGFEDDGGAFAGYRSGATWVDATIELVPPVPASFSGGVAIGSTAWLLAGDELYYSGELGVFAPYGGTGDTFHGAWARAEDDVWFVGSALHPDLVHFSGLDAALTIEPIPDAPGLLYGIWGTGSGEIYAVGENGAIVHRK